MNPYIGFIIILTILPAFSKGILALPDSYDISLSHHQRGENNAALDEINKTDYWDSTAWNLKGDILMDLNRSDEAEGCYIEAKGLDSTYIPPRYSLAEIKTSRRNCQGYRSAIDLYDEIINIDNSEYMALTLKADTYIKLKNECNIIEGSSQSRNASENYELAIESYSNAIELNSSYLPAWNNKGIALGYLGRSEESVQCFNQSLSINSSFAESLNNKGVTLAKIQRYGESLDSFNEALQINPDLPEAWYNKAKLTIEMDINKYEVAKEYYNKSIQLKPELKDKGIMDYIYITAK